MALKSCPKFNKSPNLVILAATTISSATASFPYFEPTRLGQKYHQIKHFKIVSNSFQTGWEMLRMTLTVSHPDVRILLIKNSCYFFKKIGSFRAYFPSFQSILNSWPWIKTADGWVRRGYLWYLLAVNSLGLYTVGVRSNLFYHLSHIHCPN